MKTQQKNAVKIHENGLFTMVPYENGLFTIFILPFFFNNGKNSQLDDELIKKRSTQAIEKFIERERNKKE